MLMQCIQKSLVTVFVCLGVFHIAYEAELSASMKKQTVCNLPDKITTLNNEQVPMQLVIGDRRNRVQKNLWYR